MCKSEEGGNDKSSFAPEISLVLQLVKVYQMFLSSELFRRLYSLEDLILKYSKAERTGTVILKGSRNTCGRESLLELILKEGSLPGKADWDVNETLLISVVVKVFPNCCNIREHKEKWCYAGLPERRTMNHTISWKSLKIYSTVWRGVIKY